MPEEEVEERREKEEGESRRRKGRGRRKERGRRKGEGGEEGATTRRNKSDGKDWNLVLFKTLPFPPELEERASNVDGHSL